MKHIKTFEEHGYREREAFQSFLFGGPDISKIRKSAEVESLVDELNEYSFQFEDEYGTIWSSYDINQTIRANDDQEAIVKADELLDNSSLIESAKILSVNRIS